MKVVFRVDASVNMGTGHLMRCLTLAETLRECNNQVGFVCREHKGNLIDLLQHKSFPITVLPAKTVNDNTVYEDDYPAWLGSTQQEDANQTIEALNGEKPAWLVIDHYSLDVEWEQRLRPHVQKIAVIDDLANRTHDCDVLLDQNWLSAETEKRYTNLVPKNCSCLLGPRYALLRPEYAQFRAVMPPRNGTVNRVLVFLGGSDPTNETGKVLEALMLPHFSHLVVDVVLGINHPAPESIAFQIEKRPLTFLYQNLPSLAGIMVRSDLMIGGGGSTSWERMCLGLSSLVISIADNQTELNRALMKSGFIDYLGHLNEVTTTTIVNALHCILAQPQRLLAQSARAQKLVSGAGTIKLCNLLISSNGEQDVAKTP